jgi:hypothetical protein
MLIFSLRHSKYLFLCNFSDSDVVVLSPLFLAPVKYERIVVATTCVAIMDTYRMEVIRQFLHLFYSVYRINLGLNSRNLLLHFLNLS